MCYNPVTIINPCKYVSLRFRERYLIQVPCGHCAQCATNKSNEWYFRTYYQTLDTLTDPKGKAFVLFDTLTYRNKDLPYISDFVSVPVGCDYPCFNSRHIQLFNKKLRKACSKKGSFYKFFLTSEYGTSENHSHRPHYHILIYSDGNIEPLELSALIAKCWQYGRTDGLPYKTVNYVRGNIFTSDKFAESLRTCRYVSKYIQKSCKFEKEITKRLDHIMLTIAEKMIDGWIDSPHAKRVRMKYARLVGQFHRQSKEFGASYLRDIDITDFDSVNQLYMPDSKKVHLSIPLPMYYKRKMYYEVKKIDGNNIWIPTDLGLLYLQSRDKILKDNLVNRFKALNHQANVFYDSERLADYVLYYRGRIRAIDLPKSPIDKYCAVDLYSYSTLSDREHIDELGLTKYYAGNNTIGYRCSKLYNRIKFKDFISRYVILDDDYEKQLDQLYNSCSKINDNRQKAFELRQHLVNLYHYLGII